MRTAYEKMIRDSLEDLHRKENIDYEKFRLTGGKTTWEDWGQLSDIESEGEQLKDGVCRTGTLYQVMGHTSIRQVYPNGLSQGCVSATAAKASPVVSTQLQGGWARSGR